MMKIIQKLTLVCVACAGMWATGATSKIELVGRVALAESIMALDVDGVAGSLASLEAVHAHVDVLPLLEKLGTTKALTRRWPAKLGAVIGGGVSFELLCRGLCLFGLFPKFKDCADAREQALHGRNSVYQAFTPPVVFAGCMFGAYKGYKVWINKRTQRVRKIAQLLLNSPVAEVGHNADVLVSQLSVIAAQCGTSVYDLAAAKCN